MKAVLTSHLVSQGFTASSSESALLSRRTTRGTQHVLMCASDCLLVCDDVTSVSDLYASISPHLPSHGFVLPASFDGIEIDVDEKAGSINITQSEYARQLLRSWDMDGSTRVSTPQPLLRFHSCLTILLQCLLPHLMLRTHTYIYARFYGA